MATGSACSGDSRVPPVAQRGVDDGQPVREGAVVGLHRRQGPVHPLLEVLRPVPTLRVEFVPGQPVPGADDPAPPAFFGVVAACLEHALVVGQLHEVAVGCARRRAGLGVVDLHPGCGQECLGHGRCSVVVTVAHDVVLHVDGHVRPVAVGLGPLLHPDEEVGLTHTGARCHRPGNRPPMTSGAPLRMAGAGALLPLGAVEGPVDLHGSFHRRAEGVEHLALVGDAPPPPACP